MVGELSAMKSQVKEWTRRGKQGEFVALILNRHQCASH